MNQPLVDLAESALRHFGGDVKRGTAKLLLDCWTHRKMLTPQDQAAVLARFPAPSEVQVSRPVSAPDRSYSFACDNGPDPDDDLDDDQT